MKSNDKKNNLKNNSLSKFLLENSTPTRSIPPLEKWTPTTIVPFDIMIDNQGQWWHEGAKMTRQSLIDLFASVLWAEGEGNEKRHFLKTPHDKYEIKVIDTPLFVCSVDVLVEDGQSWLVFGTTNGDVIRLAGQKLYFQTFCHDGRCEERLYLDTRFNLTARINRNVFYHLTELGEMVQTDDGVALVLHSGEYCYRLVSHQS